jgi:DNA-binding MurR/RpiR family transcriptional regulator
MIRNAAAQDEIMTIQGDSFTALRERILEQHSSLSTQLQKIARFALDNPDFVALESVTAVAKAADVQPSAVVRCAQAFGFNGFSAFQKPFRENLVAVKDSYRQRIRMLDGDKHPGQTRILDEFADAAIRTLTDLQHELPQERIDAAVALLARADEIFILGLKRSYAVAHYLNYALSRLDTRNTLIDGTGGMIDHQVARCRPGRDVLLAISFAPYTESVVSIAAEQAARGVDIVAITDSPLSPLADHARVLFEVPGGDLPFRSLAAPLCLAQTLVVTLGQAMEGDENPGALQ